MAIYNLNIELLHPLNGPQMFTQIDQSLRSRLDQMPEVLERIKGCVHFCYQTNVNNEPVDGEVTKKRRRFLRAALAEYGGILDAARWDFDAKRKNIPTLKTILHPQIHIIRLLRHANIHLGASDLEHASHPATWQGPEGEEKIEYEYFTVVDTEKSIRGTDRASDYRDSDLKIMLDWLEREQQEWGIANVIHRVAELHGKVLADEWEKS